MIVCSCNVLTKEQILSTLESDPRSPAHAYRCLGCAPECGRCLVTVRKLLAEAKADLHAAACKVGCATCPGHAEMPAELADEPPAPFLIAAE